MASKDITKTATNSDQKPSRTNSPVTEKSLEQSWSRVVVDPMTVRSNALQIPRNIIKNYIHGGGRPIRILDCDNGVPYHCLLKKRKRSVERYLLGDWYDYAKEVNLKVGDTMHFGIRYPPVDKIFVSVERGNATQDWQSW